MAGLRAAFPDQHFTIEDEMIGEGDKVVFRYVYRGTHQGEFQGIAPTGKQVAVAGINICQITGGRIGEIWVASDLAGVDASAARYSVMAEYYAAKVAGDK